jgi:hypothetical protein
MDFYGHGLSARPAIDYTIDLFATQVRQLLDLIGFPKPATVLDHSLGAAVAATLTAGDAIPVTMLPTCMHCSGPAVFSRSREPTTACSSHTLRPLPTRLCLSPSDSTPSCGAARDDVVSRR